MTENYDFSGYIIKYNIPSICNKFYKIDSLKDSDGLMTPLLWNHDHENSMSMLGYVKLEHREDGMYAYCMLYNDARLREIVEELIRDKEVWLSPYISRVKYDGAYIAYGKVTEVSLVLARIDPDDAYRPVWREKGD